MNYADQIKSLKYKVIQMLQERSGNFQQTNRQHPTPIWTEALSVFDYIINLSEENFLNIRLHTNLITGANLFAFWHPYPPIDPEKFAYRSGYSFLTEDLPEAYWIGEPPTPKIPRPLGINYKGKIINADICRYQSCVSNLYSMGILTSFLEKNNKNIIVEIGAGYGAFAHQLGNILAKKSTYIILDFPEMLLFSGGFLIVNNPEKNIYIYEKNTFTPEFLRSEIYNYDYVLVPNYVLKDLYALAEINLMVNMQSFQEMSKEQINEYAEFAYRKLSGYLYSDNIDIHPYNNELGPDTVSTILANRFCLFPSPGFYDKHVKVYKPWLYKCYFGIGKNKNLSFSEDGTMKLIKGGDRFLLYLDHNGRLEFKVKRDWVRHLGKFSIRLAKKLLK